MILGFSTQINNKATYFVERITKGIYLFKNMSLNGLILFPMNDELELYNSSLKATANKLGYNDFRHLQDALELINPKLHTIRKDKTNRWQPGTKIDFFINVRKKNMFRFAPVLPVVSVQKVEIVWVELFGKKVAHVFIEDNFFAKVKFDSDLIVKGDMLQLALNDGFDSIEDFFAYFNEDFTGKLIHWTDLKY